MGKQLRPPERRNDGGSALDAVDQAVGTDAAALAESNAVAGERLSDAGDGGWAVVRDTALPVVERAMLVLQLAPREAQQVDRFVSIIEASRLPEDRKAELVDRLRTDEATSQGVSDAVVRWFGADTETIRGDLLDVLGRTHRELGLTASEGMGSGSTSARADALIGEVGGRSGAGELSAGPETGAAVRGFCRDVQFALLWDEDEEEEGSASAEPIGAE